MCSTRQLRFSIGQPDELVDLPLHHRGLRKFDANTPAIIAPPDVSTTIVISNERPPQNDLLYGINCLKWSHAACFIDEP